MSESVIDVGRGIRLCCDTIGDPGDPPVVLIPGLGQQFHAWPQQFAETLADRGLLVTRIDNRDVGRSTHMSFPAPKPWAIVRGGNDRRQYHLGDMARDAVGLLDALGYRDAHLVGISMGGMIAQTVAAHYPGRVRTLTSLMSTTDPDDDQWLWDINFHGVVNGTRAFLPILVEQDEGAIVNTSSVFGLAGIPN